MNEKEALGLALLGLVGVPVGAPLPLSSEGMDPAIKAGIGRALVLGSGMAPPAPAPTPPVPALPAPPAKTVDNSAVLKQQAWDIKLAKQSKKTEKLAAEMATVMADLRRENELRNALSRGRKKKNRR